MKTRLVPLTVLTTLLLASLAGPMSGLAQGTVIPLGSTWKYLDTGVDQGSEWTALTFDDSSWKSGRAELGYGDNDEATVISYGPSSTNKFPTAYFRRTFTVADPAAWGPMILTLVYDDGAVVYVNGGEVFRLNLPEGTVSYSTWATVASNYQPVTTDLSPSVLIAGTNVIAVEMHQGNRTSSDLSFDLSLVGTNTLPSVTLVQPTNDAAFVVGTPIVLVADASDLAGVAQVEFFRGTSSLGVDTTSPYSVSVSNLIEGSYTFTAAVMDIDGATVTSMPVTIHVSDPNPPVLLSATGTTNQVTVFLSKRVVAPGALAAGNYRLDLGATVLVAGYGAASNIVLLTTSPLAPGASYTLTVSNVQDAAGQSLAPGSQARFTVSSFQGANIGNPALAGSAIQVGSGFDVVAAGTGINGTSDQFYFASESRTGNFDVKVRVQSLSLSDAWATAGLMARESLAAGSRFAATLAPPALSGTFFCYRFDANGNTTNGGAFPVTYPATWLRLQRNGNLFVGYAGFDGEAWTRLGSVTMNLPGPVLLGLALSSRNTNAPTTAQFRDYANVTNSPPGVALTLPREPLGPCSRRSGLVFSEIMYHPRREPSQSAQLLEFIEIYNAEPLFHDLSGYRLTGAIDYTFPTNTVMPAGSFLVVARDPAALQASCGLADSLGPWDGAITNGLPDDEGRLRLRHRAGEVLLEVNYRGQAPWPMAADGTGHSMVLARPSYGEDDPRAWTASEAIGGSPGRDEPFTSEPLSSVVINEFLANSELPAEDFVELYNHSNQEVDLSGAYLSDDRDTNKFRIPDGTRLGPRGFVAFTESTLGFALSSGGERIYLVNSNQSRVIDVAAFGGQATGVSSGRYPDGAPDFCELTTPTFATTNAAPLRRDIVINEIMFNPISGNSDDEYLELYNRGTNTVNLGLWRLSDGVNFTFPANTLLAPGGYLVVARNTLRLMSHYPHLTSANTVGNYSGSLDNGGERIALSMPEVVVTTNGTVTNYIVVNAVTYDDGGRWGQWADRGGSSLELIDPYSDNRLAPNWADSDETAKAPWTNVVFTGLMDHVYMRDAAGAALDEIQVMILGAGEALVDDVEVRGPPGTNVVRNSTFNSGLSNWVIQGNHMNSGFEPTGPNNPSPCLHLRASGGGDNGANRVECDLSLALPANTNGTIAAKLRWLCGHPDVLLRLHGGGLELLASLPIPTNLGTPGQPNSRAVLNAGPAIVQVSHSPVMPPANEPVVVTARVSDPDGLSAVQLRYRLDPSATLLTVPMNDAGTNGDAVAGDGLFSATLPAQTANTLVAFRIEATDAAVPAAGATFPHDAPARECLVRFGETPQFGSFAAYRFWMTASNMNQWSVRERMSNQAQDGTFVYGDGRAIYNAGARYRGSPFMRPNYSTSTGAPCGYIWTLPEDDRFLGEDELNLDSMEPAARDATALREVTCFSMFEQMGLPFSHQRFVHLVINGVNNTSRGIPIYTDSQQPNSDYIKAWFPDESDGEIFKIDDWFEFSDAVTMQGWKSGSLENFTTTGGVKKQARYRWSWEKKSNGGLNDDYSRLYEVDDALNAPDASYVSAVEAATEAEEWILVFALRHVVSDYDGYGYRRGKNQFLYFPPGQKAWMLMWDLDYSLGIGHSYNQDLFFISLDGPTGVNHMPEIGRLYNHGYFRRAYLRALQRIADGPLLDAAYLPILTARYQSFLDNGVVTTTSPFEPSGAQSLPVPTWIQQRRAFTLSTLGTAPTAAFTVSATNLNIADNVVTLTGTAPLGIQTIKVNGAVVGVTWSGATPVNWSIRLPLQPGTNQFEVTGYDPDGEPVASTTRIVTVNSTSQLQMPEGAVVISEIMYRPAATNASYVELRNLSPTATFDLSNWRINGLGYTFQPGSFLGPGAHLTLVKNTAAFTAAYRTNAFDVFDGNFDPNGETLTLLRPDPATGGELVVDRVRYEPNAPWPAGAVQGAALQLIDPTQDNSRVANWSDAAGWRYASVTGNILNATNLMIFMNGVGEVYLDDISLVTSNGPNAGQNAILNGGFESPLAGTWLVGLAVSNSSLSTEVKRSGHASLHLIANAAGTTVTNTLRQLLPGITLSNVYTLSYWYYTSFSGDRITARTYPGFSLVAESPVRGVAFTPNATNSTQATLPPFPPLWLNEVQPENVNGVTDSAGEHAPWIELYNAGTNALSLDGMFLANNYTNLTPWAFPTGTVMLPGEFKVVFADGQSEQSTATELHTSFALAAGSGTVVLSRLLDGAPQILDYFNYRDLPAGLSYGAYLDGQPFYRQEFHYATPGGTNDARTPPAQIFINEWMAANTSTLTDPADYDFDDWFELYNPGSNTVDLAGWTLTDNFANPTQFRIPSGYSLSPYGFLLVWADSETGQNNSNRADLHVSFKLEKNGEAIALYAPDGTFVDAVVFGQQVNNVSMGRQPDGSTNLASFLTPTPRTANPLPLPPSPVVTLAVGDNVVTITFSTTPGISYRVDYRDSLSDPEWRELIPAQEASGTVLSVTDPIGDRPQRFYRVVAP
ncbi:MAG: lamin tail domain-containing protein [Verrucomicrobia bacterium]|nr:lamin tail domain-containing protein [Verrucomicrobiota bacterium]